MQTDSPVARAPSGADGPLLDFDTNIFRAKYNEEGFLFRHRLAEHPLMQLPKLAELALRMDPAQILHRVGKVPESTDFDHAHKRHAATVPLEDSLRNIRESGASVTINEPERDGEYRPLVNAILAEIREMTEPLDPGMNWSASYIFIAAPGSLTPYHMDREMNFLLHMRGSKTVKLWNPADRTVMTEAEVDRLFGRFDLPRPTYRDDLAPKAVTYELVPGLGLHHPFIAPHLVYNGSDVGISLAVTFRTRGSDRLTRLHIMNHRLRAARLRPKPVGTSPRRDEAKLRAFSLLEPLAGVARKLRKFAVDRRHPAAK